MTWLSWHEVVEYKGHCDLFTKSQDSHKFEEW
jgi:hypothetical protein